MVTELTAKNIYWDVDADEIRERLSALPVSERADWFGEKAANLEAEELENVAFDVFHHRPGLLDDFLGLPKWVDIPHGIDEDDVCDYLSDTYGYCINGFELETRYPEAEV